MEPDLPGCNSSEEVEIDTDIEVVETASPSELANREAEIVWNPLGRLRRVGKVPAIRANILREMKSKPPADFLTFLPETIGTGGETEHTGWFELMYKKLKSVINEDEHEAGFWIEGQNLVINCY